MIALLDTTSELTTSWVLDTILVIAGVIGLVGGGHLLVEGAISVAKRLGMSTLMIGLTIVAFGTSAPELALNVVAAIENETGLAFGNVIGSNIANLGLVLGITAIVAPIPISKSAMRLGGIPWLVIVTTIAIILPWVGGGVEDRAGYASWAGVVLLCFAPATILIWYLNGRRNQEDSLDELSALTTRSLPASLLLVVVGLVLLVAGGKATETGAVNLARWMGLSEAVIGLSIVAVATSLPEVVTSVIAARRGAPGLAIGTVIGSNMFNLALVLGTTAVVTPVALPPTGGLVNLFIMGGLTVLLIPLAASGRRINAVEGLFLLLAWAGTITYGILRESG